jgi:hypothetical protein
MKQNNQSSWAARLRGISALCLALMVSAGAWAADKLTITPNIKAGETGTIAISLDNETAYTAFQMEITLPDKLSIEEEGAIVIASERANLHQVKYNAVDGVVRVAAFSFDGSDGNKAFNGNEGDLLIITVTAAADYTPADVTISDIIFVTEADLAAVKDITAEMAEEDGLMGDVDGDGSVTVLDGLAIIDYYLKKNPTPFNVAVADLDQDGAITVLDGLAAIDIYLKK